ncbi:MAG: MFS transporter [Alphaproteobacteria bacterium]
MAASDIDPRDSSRPWGRIGLISCCQGLTVMANSIVFVVSALATKMITTNANLFTFPIFCQHVSATVTAVPASLIMRQFGRRIGFSIGAISGVSGAMISVVALYKMSLSLLCLGALFLGIFQGFGSFYRFAALELAPASAKARAMSWAVGGGILAALFGPQLARSSYNFIPTIPFAGSYAAYACLGIVILCLLQVVVLPKPSATVVQESRRDFLSIVIQPTYLVAVTGSAISYAVMSFLMTATPLAMADCDFDLADTAFVIQWHILGMFAPSLVTGRLIEFFGVRRIMIFGAVLMTGSLAVALSGQLLMQFWLALFLLGVGWNFLFIGGSTLLTETSRPQEKAIAQGFHDAVVAVTIAMTTLSSGPLQGQFG